MSEPKTPERSAPETWSEALGAWRVWLTLEAVRQTPEGREEPTLARMATQRRDACLTASRALLTGRTSPCPPSTVEAKELLLQMASRVGRLRSEVANGGQPLAGAYGLILIGELCALIALMDLALARTPQGPTITSKSR